MSGMSSGGLNRRGANQDLLMWLECVYYERSEFGKHRGAVGAMVGAAKLIAPNP